ncbi:MAG: insulinase family protein [Eggerthellaceae bacterium]|nr:insulinase family protein [Eggerthellaceae bacterium]
MNTNSYAENSAAHEDIAKIAKTHGFELQGFESIPEIEGDAFILKHEASKARLLYLKNEDPNKAFSISFKTPADDDTGVFHILEHSVLCGSEKFPVKEPFVNLLKSSMQTFLNAMTFPDKTMYPVASTNEQDLLNLADVYLDAVFSPAIYQKRTIFEQEGWHYELAEGDNAKQDDKPSLVYNGVVFNEMKGALSDPESVLYDALSAALFPDTCYRFESGGIPKAIVDLTYEGYLDTHARHYRPDNSYITLYGNLDLDTFLAFLNERYLSPLAAIDRGPLSINPLDEQKPVRALNVKKTMPTAEENAACAVGFVIGHARERKRLIAADILLDAIMGSNEAPMKRALLDAGIAADASAFIADAVVQPFAVVQLRGLEKGCASQLRQIVTEQALHLAEGGLDHELVEAALSHAEFVMRERNFGYADGVMLAMASMSGWLYGDDLACAYLRYDDAFAELRKELEEGYFEQLIRELFLNNDHMAEVELVPTAEDEDAALSERLAKLAANMSDEDFAAIAGEVETLREAQERPDSPEDLAKLPQLAISDIGDAPAEPAYALEQGHPLPLLRHNAQKHGISYAYRYFDLERVRFEDLPYVTILAMVLGKLDTTRYSAAKLDTLIQSKLGNFSVFVEVHEAAAERSLAHPKLVISTSALEDKVEYLAKFTREIFTETMFGCQDKIFDVLMQKKVAMEQSFANAGNGAAMGRVSSYYLPAALLREQVGGVDFYLFLKKLIAEWDTRADEVTNKLNELSRLIFTDDNCMLSWSGSDEALSRFWAADALTFATREAENRLIIPPTVVKNEAFVVPTDITYTAIGFDRRLIGEGDYTGSWLVASRALSYDYLWNEVRVKGGAYGCGFQTTRQGNTRFYSFRDPHVDETIERFMQAGAWLRSFEPSESEMCGYVVSTTASFDAPVKTRELIRRQDGQLLAGYTPEDRMRIRDEVEATTSQDLRELGDTVCAIAQAAPRCTFGNREIIEASETEFTIIDLLNA